MSSLYVVATPIGNLEDITVRAVRVLKEAELILAEDTRVTRKLLLEYEIQTPVTSYHEYTGPGKIRALIEELRAGKTMALVTDAGTPGVSDPGAGFVAELIREAGDSAKIVAIPGPSAVTALLSVSGLYADRFVFHGFPPHKKGRAKFWKTVAECATTGVFYESPHRIEKAMAELAPLCDGARRIVIGRELTKMFESVRYGTMKDAATLLANEPIKGEYVVAVEGK
jgi:16S rRNA (cytidine1402-2'-O)-methyltransferase